MNISVVVLCFALMCNSLQEEQTKVILSILSFVLLTNAMNCIPLSKDKNGHVYSYLFLKRSVFLTKLMFSLNCLYC